MATQQENVRINKTDRKCGKINFFLKEKTWQKN